MSSQTRTIVLALSLLAVTIQASPYPENIQAVKELPQVQDTLAFNEALASDVGEIRATRSCGTCSGFPNTAGVSSNQVFSSIKTSSSPGVVHTASSYEGCSTGTGCGGVKIEDGKVIEQYGNSEAVKAASSALAGGDLKNLAFQAGLGGAATNSVFNDKLPKDGPFWWMQENSPFRNAYAEFQKSGKISSSVSGIQGGGALNLAGNPFLNGDISKLASSFVSAGTGSTSNSANGAFGHSQSSGLGAIDISNNPFLNGKVSAGGAGGTTGQSSFQASFQSSSSSSTAGNGGSVDISKNPFLNGAFGGAQFSGSKQISGSSLAGSSASGNSIRGGSLSGGVLSVSGSQGSSSGSHSASVGNGCAGSPNGACQSGSLYVTGQKPLNSGVTSSTAYQAQTIQKFGASGTHDGANYQGSSLQGTTGYQGGSQQTNRQGGVNYQGSSLQGTTNYQGGSQQTTQQGGYEASLSGNYDQQQQQEDITSIFGGASKFTGSGSTSEGAGLTITCTSKGFVCVPKAQCVNGLVNTNGAGLLEARTRDQYCKSSIEACCRLPAESNSINVNQYQGSSGSISSSSGLTHIVGSTPRFGLDTQFGSINSLPNYQSKTPVGGDSFVSASQNVYRPGSEPGQKPGLPYLPPITPDSSNVVPPVVVSTTTHRPYVPPQTLRTTQVYIHTTRQPTTNAPTYLPPKSTTPAPPYLPPYVVDSNNERPTYVKYPVDGSLYLDETIEETRPSVPVVPAGCAAALKCTPIEYCTAEGVISNTTVILTKDQAEFRVPLTDCKDVISGTIGKCCRDPTYTDPWPTGLIGKWDANIFGSGKYVPNDRTGGNNTPRTPTRFSYTTQPTTGSTLVEDNIVPNKNRGQFGGNRYQLEKGAGEISITGQDDIYKTSGFIEQTGGYSEQRVQLQRYDAGSQCGIKRGQRPFGDRNELEVDFAEIPWQAMILLETNRSLLCGGVITRPDVVITAAHCVEGLVAKNVLIKGGEWKLGIDEEPKPFQIVQVKHILRHPGYQPGNLLNDVAILVLTEKLRLADNIYPICLPGAHESFEAYFGGGGQCIVTGWGKQVLQVNVAGSIMHELNVSLIRPNDCQSKISQEYPHLLEQYNTDSCVCGQPINPANSVCKVDIGSALACSNGDGHFVLRGVYSWDSGCQLGNQLAAFYKFDLEWYEWALGLSSGGGRFTTGGQASYQQIQGGNVHAQQSGQSFGQQSGQSFGINNFGSANTRTQTNQGFGINGQFNSAKGGHVTSSRKEFSQQGVIVQGSQGGQLGIQGNIDDFNKQVAGLQQQFQKGGFVKGQTYHVSSKTQLPTVTKTFHTEERKVIQHPTITLKYEEKPRLVSSGQYSVSYEQSGSGQNPQYIAPGVSFNPGFESVVKGHNHAAGQQCKCVENGK